ncbi:LysE family translocator [Aliiroseovarius sp. F47248L]|uniref:LysE family translocator n=1 Tax=Aliiroseovarius sp. F47248L TaxID=2926420 RepID=UPI001FF6A366|nr:LysE family translocator [Aliiroseovarius sp. F47248L]MCK0138304.1 LysE family translocator [Aliiroseovarius sp. F47248L]
MFSTTLALILFLAPLAYSPGPGNMVFATMGARFGLRTTLPANFGYHVATWLVTFGLGLGFSALIAKAPTLFEVLRWAGAVYVAWLAWTFLRAGLSGADRDKGVIGVLDGVLLLVLNPKAYVIIALMFSQFLTAFPIPHLAAVLWITTIFTLNNFVAFLFWTVVGDGLLARFRHRDHARHLNGAFATMLGLVAVWLFVAGGAAN